MRRKELRWDELEKLLKDTGTIFEEESITNITLVNPKKLLIDSEVLKKEK